MRFTLGNIVLQYQSRETCLDELGSPDISLESLFNRKIDCICETMLTPRQFYKYTTSKTFIQKQIKVIKQYDGDYRKHEWLEKSTVFTAGRKTLIYIGASHVIGSHPFISFLKKAFEESKPQFVLVERSKSIKRETLSLQTESRPKETWSEVDWAVHLAIKSHIGFAGMDVEDKMFFEPLLRLKDGMKVGILVWMVKYYNQNKSGIVGDSLTHPEDRYEFAKEMLIQGFLFPHGHFEHFKSRFLLLKKQEYKHTSVSGMIDSIITEMSRKYIAKKPFLELFENEDALYAPYGPWTDSTKYEINKINAYINAYRDVSMINECVAKMKKFDRVFAIAGSGHIQVEADFLAKEISKNFGTCEVRKWTNI